MARLSVGEAITNIMWAKLTALTDIKCSGNWMWAAKVPGEGARLYDAAVALRDILIDLGIAIDGGKDSLSMAALVRGKDGKEEIVKSPGTLVISAYAPCPDITKTVTPDIKRPGKSGLIYIDLGEGRYRPGGSALAQVFKQVGNDTPDLENPELLKKTFHAIQSLIDRGLILSGHDRSDGGLITTLLEMAFGGNSGIKVDIRAQGVDPLKVLFSEELGVVFEYPLDKEEEVFKVLNELTLPYQRIGLTTDDREVSVSVNGEVLLSEDMRRLRAVWEETSYQLDRLQANPECVDEERKAIYDRPGPGYHVSFSPEPTAPEVLSRSAKPRVAIIREEGSNSDREMASAFYQAGFEPWDITMSDLVAGRIGLSEFKGVAFVGGFSYADVLDSAKGWAGVIRFNPKVFEEFQRFYNRPDTFSLGVCNGCQLMALLGWVPWQGIEDRLQPRFIHNRSGRFESRFSTVRILSSPSIMLKEMEDSVLGVWVAHGEGRVYFPSEEILSEVLKKGLAPIRYVDDEGNITETYPFNPNGSPHGITALCSPDGRHLAMMPHPERTFLKWQWAWMPENLENSLKASPWLRLFQNARQWLEQA